MFKKLCEGTGVFMNFTTKVINRRQLIIDPNAIDAFHLLSQCDYFFTHSDYNLQELISTPTFELPFAYKDGQQYCVFANWHGMQPHLANANDEFVVVICDRKPTNLPLIPWLYVFHTYSRMMSRNAVIGNLYTSFELCPRNIINKLLHGAVDAKGVNTAFLERLLVDETRQSIRTGVNKRR